MFEIAGVPPGGQQVVVWRGRFGALRRPVPVEAGAGVSAQLDYPAEG